MGQKDNRDDEDAFETKKESKSLKKNNKKSWKNQEENYCKCEPTY